MRRIITTATFTALLAGCSAAQPESEWVTFAGGCFTMGEQPAYPEEGPPTQACVEPFEIATHEVTNAQFAAFVDATGYATRAERGWSAADPGGPGVDIAPASAVFVQPEGRARGNLDWWRLVEGASWRAPLGPGADRIANADHPVVHVTREDAEAYARWASARLPSEAEWEFAARATPDGKITPLADVDSAARSRRANTWQGVFPIRNSRMDGYEGIAPVGSFPANDAGLYDMIGNVWEWTATPFAPSHRERDRGIAGNRGFDPGQPNVAVGTIKGGSYLCADNYCARFRPAARQAQDLAFGTSHIGFRLARSVAE